MREIAPINMQRHRQFIPVVADTMDIAWCQAADIAAPHDRLVSLRQLGEAGLGAIIIAPPHHIALLAFEADYDTPGLVIMRGDAASRHPAHRLDQDCIVGFFVEDSDADTLLFLCFIAARLEP